MYNEEILIKLENISKIYDKNNEKIMALDKINLSFSKNSFYAIMGHTGSGKSTLVNLMGMIDSVYEGEYYLYNKNVSLLKDNQLSNIRMEKIGFIFQDFKLNPNLTAIENILLPMLINKKIKYNERIEVARNLLGLVGLKDREKHFPKELSGGEQQRVAMARALANNPEILLADEPTGNLDENNENQIFQLLKNISKNGKCVIVVSHSNEVKKYADEIIRLNQGKIRKNYESKWYF